MDTCCFFCKKPKIDLTVEFGEDMLVLCSDCASELLDTLAKIYSGYEE